MSKREHFFIPVMGVPWWGKNTMIAKLTNDHPHLFTQVLSDKTRNFRNNNGNPEKEWVDYYKKSMDDFKLWVWNNEYIEWNEYKDNNTNTILGYYGTNRQLLLDTLQDHHVIKELDPNGYTQLIDQNIDFPYFGLYIDIQKDSVFRKRMIARGTKNNTIITSFDITNRVNLASSEREIAYILSQDPSNHFHLIDGDKTIEEVYSQFKTVIGNYIPLQIK